MIKIKQGVTFVCQASCLCVHVIIYKKIRNKTDPHVYIYPSDYSVLLYILSGMLGLKLFAFMCNRNMFDLTCD